MTVNSYFNHNDKDNIDSRIYEDLIIESIQMYGLNVYYLPRDIIEEDKIFNEEILSKFGEAYEVEVYPTTVDGFGGTDLLAKFGLQIKDEVTLVIAKRRFDAVLGSLDTPIARPREGDLIFYPPNGALFEIRFVEDEVPFYQLNNLPVYELQCELFTYENQDFDTGLDDIDQIEGEYAVVHEIKVSHNGTPFEIREDITISDNTGDDILGEVIKTKDYNGHWIFEITHISYPAGKVKPIIPGMTITGNISGATAIITEMIDIKDDKNYGDNEYYYDDLDDIVDFNEDNPFGGM